MWRIYDTAKDTYVFLSLIFVYLFFIPVIRKNDVLVNNQSVFYALSVPIILNIVGMMLAYKSSDVETKPNAKNDDLDKTKSLIIVCFVLISLVVLLTENHKKSMWFIMLLLYILSSLVVYYANSSNTKIRNATG